MIKPSILAMRRSSKRLGE